MTQKAGCNLKVATSKDAEHSKFLHIKFQYMLHIVITNQSPVYTRLFLCCNGEVVPYFFFRLEEGLDFGDIWFYQALRFVNLPQEEATHILSSNHANRLR
jgi:hypothetical protein